MPSRDTSPNRHAGRRAFLKQCGTGLGAAGLLSACHSGKDGDLAESVGAIPPDPARASDAGALSAKDIEQFGIRHMSELDRLPWFKKNEAGEICLRPDAGIGPIVDTHSHVGWAYGLGRSVDMKQKSPVKYFYDYERDQDVLFTQDHPTSDESSTITRENLAVFAHTPARNRTHTAANLAAEMDRMNYRNIVLLPIEIPHTTRHSEDTFSAAKLDQRLVPFGGIYPKPWGPAKIAQLEKQVKDHGIKAIKYHPVFQLMAPGDPNMMSLFAWCEAHDILVYAHIGYTGKEPKFMREKSEPSGFTKPLEAFPKLRMVFAHTGVRRIDQALEVARKFEDRVWVDISGRSAANIGYIFQRYDKEKILYASDWPFMPLAIMLARALAATEKCPQVRAGFLSGNAVRLLGLPA